MGKKNSKLSLRVWYIPCVGVMQHPAILATPGLYTRTLRRNRVSGYCRGGSPSCTKTILCSLISITLRSFSLFFALASFPQHKASTLQDHRSLVAALLQRLHKAEERLWSRPFPPQFQRGTTTLTLPFHQNARSSVALVKQSSLPAL